MRLGKVSSVHVDANELRIASETGTWVFEIDDLEVLYDQVKAEVLPWLMERDMTWSDIVRESLAPYSVRV